MRLFKVMMTQDQRTKLFQCHIKDYTRKEEVRGVSRNPMEAFNQADKQLTESLHWLQARDEADWDED